MSEILTTDCVKASQALAYWTDLICGVYVGLDCEAPRRGHFHSQIRRFDLPAIRLTEVGGSPQHVTRSKRRLARSPSDDFLINLQLSGRSKVVQDGRVAETAPGDLALYDASRPYELLMDEPFRMVVFQIARPMLRQRLAEPERLTARRVAGDAGFGLAASRFLRSVPAASEVDAAGGGLLERHVLDILSTAFGTSAGATVQGDRQSARLVAAKAQIDRSFSDPCFGREELAASLGLSLRGLTRLFALEDDTPSAYLRRRRLERCRADLASPAMDRFSATDIALSHGFNDSAHFSRIFRDAFGETPTHYRARTKAERN
ncbi:MAG TPA: helix-turn-helix domain-containing protein [Xanthobacteraceae bacterium]|nr:helix-turn-helix domain-containing protein [Xanthobacteraceae bacterium]